MLSTELSPAIEDGDDDRPQQKTSEALLSESKPPFSTTDNGGVIVASGKMVTVVGGLWLLWLFEEMSEFTLLQMASGAAVTDFEINGGELVKTDDSGFDPLLGSDLGMALSLFDENTVTGPLIICLGACCRQPMLFTGVLLLTVVTAVLLLEDFFAPWELCFSPFVFNSAASAFETPSCFFHFVLRF